MNHNMRFVNQHLLGTTQCSFETASVLRLTLRKLRLPTLVVTVSSKHNALNNKKNVKFLAINHTFLFNYEFSIMKISLFLHMIKFFDICKEF